MSEIFVIKVGAEVTLVKGTKAYKGTMQKENERFIVKLTNAEPGEPDEIQLHFKEGDAFVVAASKLRMENEDSNNI